MSLFGDFEHHLPISVGDSVSCLRLLSSTKHVHHIEPDAVRLDSRQRALVRGQGRAGRAGHGLYRDGVVTICNPSNRGYSI